MEFPTHGDSKGKFFYLKLKFKIFFKGKKSIHMDHDNDSIFHFHFTTTQS